jgi:hypothetical protein
VKEAINDEGINNIRGLKMNEILFSENASVYLDISCFIAYDLGRKENEAPGGKALE